MDSRADLFWAADVEAREKPAISPSVAEPSMRPSCNESGISRGSLPAKLNGLAKLIVAFVLAMAVGVYFLAPRREAARQSAPGKSVWRLTNPVNFLMWISGTEKNLDEMQKVLNENLKSGQIKVDPNLVGQGTDGLQQIDLQKLLNPQFQLPPGSQQKRRSEGGTTSPVSGLTAE